MNVKYKQGVPTPRWNVKMNSKNAICGHYISNLAINTMAKLRNNRDFICCKIKDLPTATVTTKNVNKAPWRQAAFHTSLPTSKQPWKRRSLQAAAERSKKQLNLKSGYYTEKQALIKMSKFYNKPLCIYFIICISYTWYLVPATKPPVAVLLMALTLCEVDLEQAVKPVPWVNLTS